MFQISFLSLKQLSLLISVFSYGVTILSNHKLKTLESSLILFLFALSIGPTNFLILLNFPSNLS